MRGTSAILVVVVGGFCTAFCQSISDYESRRRAKQECVSELSGYLTNPPMAAPSQDISKLGSVTIEYVESGCYGNCPSFTLTIANGVATWNGRAYVRVKGRKMAKLSQQQFEGFLRAWYDAKFFAMRDDYCNAECPNGMLIVVTDTPGSSITLKSNEFTKGVYQCFATADGKPLTPKPPEQYSAFASQLRAFAKAQRWLK